MCSFNKDVEVKAHHGNIKDKLFGVAYMKTFDIVFNALDNVEARRHVNRICIAAERPLGASYYFFESMCLIHVLKKAVTSGVELVDGVTNLTRPHTLVA